MFSTQNSIHVLVSIFFFLNDLKNDIILQEKNGPLNMEINTFLLIDFNGMAIHLELFYVQRLTTEGHCMFI